MLFYATQVERRSISSCNTNLVMLLLLILSSWGHCLCRWFDVKLIKMTFVNWQFLEIDNDFLSHYVVHLMKMNLDWLFFLLKGWSFLALPVSFLICSSWSILLFQECVGSGNLIVGCDSLSMNVHTTWWTIQKLDAECIWFHLFEYIMFFLTSPHMYSHVKSRVLCEGWIGSLFVIISFLLWAITYPLH